MSSTLTVHQHKQMRWKSVYMLLLAQQSSQESSKVFYCMIKSQKLGSIEPKENFYKLSNADKSPKTTNSNTLLKSNCYNLFCCRFFTVTHCSYLVLSSYQRRTLELSFKGCYINNRILPVLYSYAAQLITD